MVDTVTTTAMAMGNDHDDWEVAVDTGEFDKRLEQQEKDRAATQESIPFYISSTVNDDNNQNFSNINLIKSNKPIRILKRPTSQSQLPVTNDITNSATIVATNNNNNNSPFSNDISSSTIVPVISIIPRNQTKDSINSLQIINSSTSPSLQSTKPAVKTYEQRELEYRLARLRIMGEEESSAKDDDDTDNLTIETTSVTSDEPNKATSSSTTSPTSTKTTVSSEPSLQSHSIPSSHASHLCTLNNTGAIHFTPNINSTGPSFSQQSYRGIYSVPYPQMPSTRYPTSTVYMSTTSSNYPFEPSSTTLYHYQQQPTTYETQQYDHPQ